MEKIKNILLACGTGVATSTVATQRLTSALDSRGFKNRYRCNQAKIAETPGIQDRYDVIVHTVQLPSTVTTPHVYALGLITGIGQDKIFDEVIKLLWPDEAK